MPAQKKLSELKFKLKQMDSVLVAYSGGVDSSFLLAVAKESLNSRVLAVTAVSPTYIEEEFNFAKDFCKKLGVRQQIIETNELQDKNFISNPRNRCYFCKKELFTKLNLIAKRKRIKCVLDATNFDDLGDYRPGAEAKNECGVFSPLADLGITKKEIRDFSKQYNLSSWNRPQMACLASRIQYGGLITQNRLARISQAEQYIRKSINLDGNIRVRDYGGLARVEVDKKNIPLLVKSDSLVKKLNELGFENVVIDLEGYRSGSMNATEKYAKYE